MRRAGTASWEIELMVESAEPSAGRIFISYRREETAYSAGWLFDRLADHFGGQVFKDVDSIEPGDDWVDVITRVVGSCDVLLALIGDRWLTITDEDGRPRLDDPDDFVRLEIEAALTRNVRVIPILVAGAKMPRAAELPPSLAKLARRQALVLSPANFDTSRLLRVLDKTLAEVRSAQEDAATQSAPADEAPDRKATELSEAPERREPDQSSPTPSVPPAAAATHRDALRDSPPVSEPKPRTAEAEPPDEDQPKAPDRPATSPPEAPGSQKPDESSPIPSGPPAVDGTDREVLREGPQVSDPKPRTGEAEPPPDEGQSSNKLRDRLSRRAWILAGAGGVLTIVLVVVIVANAVQGRDVVFEDDFSSQASEWTTDPAASAGQYKDGAYHISAEANDREGAGGVPESASSVNPAPSSINIKVDARLIKGSSQSAAYGILCRVASDTSYYAFVVEGDNVAIYKGNDDQLLAKDTAQIDGDGNELFATCDGDEDQTYVYLQLLVNGDQVLTTTDDSSPLPNGTVGLFANGVDSDTAIEVQFDNFVVTHA
jgi:hypothetical protein